MTIIKQVWKCSVCGNVVEVLHKGVDSLVCCGAPMELRAEQFEEEGKTEKHRPVIGGMKVSIGSVAHPMTEEHWIMWIELNCKENCYKRKFLKPGDEPKATFVVASTEGIWAREYCNLHGLWK